MKTLKNHICEALKIGKDISNWSTYTYTCQPTTKKELDQIISNRIREQGADCDLNDIDVSLITDMSHLFYFSKFVGDISCWDVSNVTDMESMFGDSQFNGDISNWNVSKVKDFSAMFTDSKFNQPIGDWDVSSATTMFGMFSHSKFDQDISNWNIGDKCMTAFIFARCPIRVKFKPKLPK